MRLAHIIPLISMTVPAACVSPSSPPPAPAPSPSAPRQPTGSAVAKSQPQDDRVTPGIWRYRQDDRGSIALFGAPGRDATFTIRCDLAMRRIFVSVIGGTSGALTLHAMTTQKGFAALSTGGTPPYSASEISALDPILDALAYSRGHFDVVLGSTRLAIPAWPEFSRVVEDCRG